MPCIYACHIYIICMFVYLACMLTYKYTIYASMHVIIFATLILINMINERTNELKEGTNSPANIYILSYNSRRRSYRMMMLVVVLIVIVIIEGGGGKVLELAEAARVFTIRNDCRETIWPGVTPGDSFEGGGFELKSGQSMVFNAPVGWSGRIWGRTGCNFDQDGNGKCQTGACGTSLKCAAAGEPPATLAEFTLAQADYYDVSLVDGFNLPMAVKPLHGQGNCTVAGCDHDLRKKCPKELSIKLKASPNNSHGKTIACRSACDVFDTDEYCCRGVYGNPVACHPTYYSKLFKQACPTSYSYAYDDPTSIFTCSQSDYLITFCSSRSQPVCTYHNNRLSCSGSGSISMGIMNSLFLSIITSSSCFLTLLLPLL